MSTGNRQASLDFCVLKSLPYEGGRDPVALRTGNFIIWEG